MLRLLISIVFLAFTVPCIAALPTTDAEGKPFPSLAPMLKTVNPAVVNIATYSTRQTRVNPLLNDPFFRRFFNIPDRRYQRPQKRQQSAGSGVIVDAEKGIVMSNFHVIKGADEVQVGLTDGRSMVAEVLGVDEDLDIAILRIEAEQLAAVSFADSDRVEVGDFVVAIGNPFGLGQTVTTGIVSALGRSGLGIEDYENFIQTDASINPGNSGGALVDLRGRLVGINTAIIAPAGGNVGIGFAIPSNMARASMEQIVLYGEVRRGEIGIDYQTISPDLRSAFDLPNGVHGVLVTDVLVDSPAAEAGVQTGDIIVSVNGNAVGSTGQLRARLGMAKIGETVAIGLLREGKSLSLSTRIGDPASIASDGGRLHPLLDGVTLLQDDAASSVVVSQLRNDSRAAYAGLRNGDRIIAVNKRRTRDLNAMKKALTQQEFSVLLQIARNGASYFVVIR